MRQAITTNIWAERLANGRVTFRWKTPQGDESMTVEFPPGHEHVADAVCLALPLVLEPDARDTCDTCNEPATRHVCRRHCR